jgi:predicted metal-dependent HD superfamily phosphohydrolase
MPKKDSPYKPRKGVRKLTDKQRAYVKLRVENPKMTKTKAVMRTYNVTKATNAGAIANTLDKNPAIQNALMAHSKLAENTIIQAILDYGDSEKQWQRTLAVETAKWAHDKIYGKAIQQNINLNQNFSEQAKEERNKYGL